MKILANILIVVGFCLGTLGAAGFAEPREPNAVLFLVLGLVALVVGGLMDRRLQERPTDTGDHHSTLAGFVAAVEAIRDKVIQLDQGRGSLDPNEIHHRIDELMRNEYFDLTSRSEELVALVGFNAYAKAWDGVATAERLLARCWSMITDGSADEGLAELPFARENIESAATEFAALGR